MSLQQDIISLNEKIAGESVLVRNLIAGIGEVIVGQQAMIERLLIGLFTNGHILIEGVPGLAKTLTVSTLASAISAGFRRIQFTPDLLPADLVGTLIFNQKTGEFTPKKGPVFTNFILADEINRAPAKVQSALLECMQEHQVTIGGTTYPLEDPFMVLATQNPIEQEGTYPLPEAQIDRFMLKVLVSYPSKDEEYAIMERFTGKPPADVQPMLTIDQLLHMRQVVDTIYMDEKMKRYILDIVFATRNPSEYGLESLSGLIEFGVSPRASIYLTKASKAHAFLKGRGYVIPEDVKVIGPDVLRHRIILTYEAEAEEKTTDDIIKQIFEHVKVP
ncbi:MAG: MoxR family ATPase [Candidatus Latescibacteria bacterium]|jgi:MoxR-like ATPase|nr:MoxR family ATPase [Candidatus Latescibacterota bacterium]